MQSPLRAPLEIQCECIPTTCRTQCGIEVVDGLLCAHGLVRGHEVDLLLDFRGLLARAHKPEEVLEHFFRLRREMEQRHYLAFYRLRRWLENHLVAHVRTNPEAEERSIHVTLNRYCLEAIKSGCVLAARQPGEALNQTTIRFAFAAGLEKLPETAVPIVMK